jgi:hypothetical protein
MENKLSKNIIFVKNFEPYDFHTETKNRLEYYSLIITYTCLEKQEFRTKSKNPDFFKKYGRDDEESTITYFDSDKEYFEFIKFLQENKIPKK